MSYSYVQQVNENLICCICRTPFVDPCTTRTCCHTFCRECILVALRNASQCPVDRSPLSPVDLVSADPLVRNLVDELIVECPNREKGCTHTCQRQLIQSHIRTSCEYKHTVVQRNENLPDNAEVTEMKQRSEKESGEHTTGETDPSVCPDCLDSVPELQAHSASCPEAIVCCPQASNGCPWSGRRNTLNSTHIQTCPYEAIKGFFTVQERRMNAVRDENQILRNRVSELEGLVRALNRECGLLREALGPWYRPEQGGSNTVTASDVPDYTYPDGVVEALARAILNPQPENTTPLPTETPSVPSTSTEPSAPHFPVLAVDIALSVNSSQQQPQVSYQYSHPPPPPPSLPYTPYSYPYPYPNFSVPSTTPTSPPGHTSTNAGTSNNATFTSPIAPLNLSTTLLGTLTSLHNTITSLSSSIDSLARQHEVAITAETMRNAEEVRSLRTAIQGLRMQIHTIMMDRNAQIVNAASAAAGRTQGDGSANTSGPPPSGLGPVAPPVDLWAPVPPGMFQRFPFPHGHGHGPVTRL
ncbi:hypothetical protein K474DRAFT_1774771 [Panus rudis PR-1116 ss-1]|nr:hypothetical protein K474DRAFT_1774771 [Panus rudis PR-1116 ss-1]